MKIKKGIVGATLLAAAALIIAYQIGRPPGNAGPASPADPSEVQVTFVELGSVNCIPCRAMQPVMRTLERKYGSQIRIVFHDVWQDDTPARKYGIRVRTGVFLWRRDAFGGPVPRWSWDCFSASPSAPALSPSWLPCSAWRSCGRGATLPVPWPCSPRSPWAIAA